MLEDFPRNTKDQNSGDKVEETEWHRVVFYDRLAEIAGEYLKKGRPVYVEGRLKTRKWQDKDGKDNYTTEIVAKQVATKRQKNRFSTRHSIWLSVSPSVSVIPRVRQITFQRYRNWLKNAVEQSVKQNSDTEPF